MDATGAGREANGAARVGRVRFVILAMLFLVTTVNYADRAVMSLAGSSMQHELGIDAVSLGYIFSAFGWAYVLAQIPSGLLLDRFGAKPVYTFSILLWSLFTLAQGAIGFFSGMTAIVVLFGLRFLLGIVEAPAFPANSAISAIWFPARERGTATAVFNSSQYAATVVFAPLMAWLVHAFGWHAPFVVMGLVGMAMAWIWHVLVHNPGDHPRISRAEIDYIEQGGGLAGTAAAGRAPAYGPGAVRLLLKSRMMMGIYLAQYCINALTYFFITWFPLYLVQARGMSILKAGFVASIPAVCGFAGGVLGGVVSDALLRRGASLSLARKTPIVLGMLLSMSMIICNYVEAPGIVVAVMALSFFGKGIGALGWAVNADTAPKQIAGLSGGLMNTFGNLSSITTPIAIGYILQRTGSFNGALVYVGVHALVACFCYLFVVGDIKRLELS
jgi:MFS transporter, ACS family, glucarate transporter